MRRDGSAWDEFLHGVAFLDELLNGGIDFTAAEFVDGEALDDFPFAVFDGADRHGGDEAFFDAVGAIGADGDRVPVTGRGWGDEAFHSIDGGVGGRGSGKRHDKMRNPWSAVRQDAHKSPVFDQKKDLRVRPAFPTDAVVQALPKAIGPPRFHGPKPFMIFQERAIIPTATLEAKRPTVSAFLP